MSEVTEPPQEFEETPQPEDSDTGSRARSAWLIPLVVVLGVGGLIAIALTRGPVQLDPTTPEGTVQEYLLALSDGRWEDAFGVLDPDSFDNCDAGDIANASFDPFTATLESSDEGGFNTFVSVRLRFGQSGVFDSGWEQWETFILVQRDGFWWITEDPWPYFRWSCDSF